MRALLVLASLMAGSALAQEAAPPGAVAPGSELGLQLGYAWAEDDESNLHGGPGVRLHLLKHLSPYFAVGPEAAVFVNAGSRIDVTYQGNGDEYHPSHWPLILIGGVARAGLVLGRVRPSVTLGLGGYIGSLRHLGVSMGAEVEVRLADWLPLFVDARFHEPLPIPGSPSNHHYRSLGLGWRMRW